VRQDTGFDFDIQEVTTTREPSEQELALLRGPVANAIRADYPDFAKKVWGLN